MGRRRALSRRIDHLLRSRFAGLLAGFAVFGLLAAACALGWLEPLELRSYDQFLRWRERVQGSEREAAPSRVVLVRIREQDIARFRHPIQDADLVRSLEKILSYQPRAVGVDLYRTFPVGAGHAALEALVRGDPRVAFIFQLPGPGEAGVPAPDFLPDSSQAALSDILPDPDGTVRRGLVFMWDAAGNAHPSLAWWLALAYLSREPTPIEPGPGRAAEASRRPIALGAGEIWRFEGNDGGYVGADDGDYQVLLDYAHGEREFASVPFSDLLDGTADPDLLRDRVVLLGTMAPTVKDDFFTPLGPASKGSPVTKGLEIHAHAVDQFLRTALDGARPIRTLSDTAEMLWLLIWSLVWGMVGDHVRSARRVLLAVVVGLALLSASFPLFLLGWWTPVVPPALAWIGAGGLAAGLALARERRDRTLLDRMLAVHVSSAVRDRLWQERDRFLDEGHLRAQRSCVTVLMSDLEGFTGASEALGDPGLVMRWLNDYMAQMVPAIESHGGVVDGYWGDAIKADFGAPVARETEEEIDRDALNAVHCAVAMGTLMRGLILTWRDRGLPPVRMRIGIFTGPVVIGSQGSPTRQKYTSLGDTVNTAARLESFDKEAFAAEQDPTACRILIGDPTRSRIGDAFRLEPLGVHGVKGKGEKIAIYRVLGARLGSEEKP
jgi:adenylate cyclase